MASQQRKKRFICFLSITLILCNFINIIRINISLFKYPYLIADFNHYYGTAWLILNKIMPYGVKFDSLPIANQFIWHERIMSATNPPVLGLATTFLALFSRNTAWLIWLSCIIFAMIISLYVLRHEISSKWPWYVQFLHMVMFTANSSVVDNIYMSQIQSILFMYVLLGWATLRHGDSFLGGVCWGVTIAIKFYTLPLLLLLLATKKIKALTSAILTILILTYVAITILGFNIYQEYFNKGTRIIHEWATKSNFNISLYGSINTLLSSMTAYNYNEPIMLAVTLFAMTLALIAVYILVTKPPSIHKFDWGTLLFVVISFAGTVISWPSYYLFIIFYITLFIEYSNLSTNSIILSSLIVIFTGNIGFGFLNNILDTRFLFMVVTPLCNFTVIIYLYWLCFSKLLVNKNDAVH